MEEARKEASESQILQPFWWDEDSTSEIWQMRADLPIKEGNFLEAPSMEENRSFSEVVVVVVEMGVRGSDNGD